MTPPREAGERRLEALLRKLDDVDPIRDAPIIQIARREETPSQALKEARSERWDNEVVRRCWLLAVLKRDYEWKFIELYGNDVS